MRDFLPYLIIAFFFALITYWKFFMPAHLKANFRFGSWAFEECYYLLDENPPKLLLKTSNDGGFRAKDIDAYHFINLQNGQTQGQYYVYARSELRGITKKHVWIEKDELQAFKMPNLEKSYSLTSLLEKHLTIKDIVQKAKVDGVEDHIQIEALNGKSYQLAVTSNTLTELGVSAPAIKPTRRESAPNINRRDGLPTEIGGDLLLDAKNLKVKFEDGSYMVSHQSLEGSTGKLIIGRATSADQWRWKKTEMELFGQVYEDGRWVRGIRHFEGVLYVIASCNDALNIIALDANNGEIKWVWEMD